MGFYEFLCSTELFDEFIDNVDDIMLSIDNETMVLTDGTTIDSDGNIVAFI